MRKLEYFLPKQWDWVANTRAVETEMWGYTILMFFIYGYKIGFFCICMSFFWNYIIILINRYRYTKRKQQFMSFIKSGFVPCIVYEKNLDSCDGIVYCIGIDEEFSLFSIPDRYNAFSPVLMFLSRKYITYLEKKRFLHTLPNDRDSENDNRAVFYKKELANLISWEASVKNIEVVIECYRSIKLEIGRDLLNKESFKYLKGLNRL